MTRSISTMDEGSARFLSRQRPIPEAEPMAKDSCPDAHCQ